MNWKACFRISQSQLQAGKGDDNLKSAFNYAKKAVDGNPSDIKVRQHFDEVKGKYDKLLEENEGEELKQELRSKIKISDAEEAKAPQKEEEKKPYYNQGGLKTDKPISEMTEDEKIEFVKV